MVIFSKLRLGMSPDVNALATIIIGIVALASSPRRWAVARAQGGAELETVPKGGEGCGRAACRCAASCGSLQVFSVVAATLVQLRGRKTARG
jgi:hypothetical protein